jgi:ABC-2 type transport system permease protein
LVTALATLIFAIGLAMGKRAITTAVAIILTIGSFLLSTFAQAVEWLEPYEKLSFFHYFPAVDIAHGTIEWANAAFYGAVIIASLVIALIFFPRRDVKSV